MQHARCALAGCHGRAGPCWNAGQRMSPGVPRLTSIPPSEWKPEHEAVEGGAGHSCKAAQAKPRLQRERRSPIAVHQGLGRLSCGREEERQGPASRSQPWSPRNSAHWLQQLVTMSNVHARCCPKELGCYKCGTHHSSLWRPHGRGGSDRRVCEFRRSLFTERRAVRAYHCPSLGGARLARLLPASAHYPLVPVERPRRKMHGCRVCNKCRCKQRREKKKTRERSPEGRVGERAAEPRKQQEGAAAPAAPGAMQRVEPVHAAASAATAAAQPPAMRLAARHARALPTDIEQRAFTGAATAAGENFQMPAQPQASRWW